MIPNSGKIRNSSVAGLKPRRAGVSGMGDNQRNKSREPRTEKKTKHDWATSTQLRLLSLNTKSWIRITKPFLTRLSLFSVLGSSLYGTQRG
jgi:hypothetical protein